MSTEHVIRWACNRCGSTCDAVPSPSCPPFWTRVEIMDSRKGDNKTLDFCPKCAEKLDDWLNDFVEGGCG